MIKKQSKSLVVDASVARAAGDPPNNPRSEICRDCLVQIRDSKHNICMTPEIQKEWDDHASRFSRKWQANMIAKKQWLYQDLSANGSLRKIIEESVLIFYDDLEDVAIFNIKNAIFKDCCLIEAALANDKTVVSLDDKTARIYFSQAAKQIKEIQEIVWVNPAKNEENVIEWLINGATAETQRFLVNYSPKNTK